MPRRRDGDERDVEVGERRGVAPQADRPGLVDDLAGLVRVDVQRQLAQRLERSEREPEARRDDDAAGDAELAQVDEAREEVGRPGRKAAGREGEDEARDGGFSFSHDVGDTRIDVGVPCCACRDGDSRRDDEGTPGLIDDDAVVETLADGSVRRKGRKGRREVVLVGRTAEPGWLVVLDESEDAAEELVGESEEGRRREAVRRCGHEQGQLR